MIEDKIVNAIIALLAGVVASFIVFSWWPAIRRWLLWRSLAVVHEAPVGGSVRCRVINGGGIPLTKAMAYLTLEHVQEDILPPPSGARAYMMPGEGATLYKAQLCWAVQEAGKNPMRADIFAGEEQPLTVAFVREGHIVVLSESCQDPARVYLARKSYRGRLKIVSADCPAKEFDIEIAPDTQGLWTIRQA